MPLEQPCAANDYLLHPDHKLSVEFLQALLTEFKGRFEAIEQVTDQVQAALSDETSSLLQDAFDNTLAPLLAQMQTSLSGMEDSIALAEDQLVAIRNGGVEAVNITLSSIEGLAAEDAQAALAELLNLIGQQAAALQAIEMNPLEAVPITEAGVLSLSKINVLMPPESADFAFPVGAVGQLVRVMDGDAVSQTVLVNLTAGEGIKINGKAEPFALKSGADHTFMFVGGNWKLIAPGGGSSGGSYATSLMFN